MSALRHLVLTLLVLAAAASAADAQVYTRGGAPPRRSVEVGGGVMWSPGFDTLPAAAELTRSGTDRLRLFSVEGDVNQFAGAHARVGLHLSSSISVEGGFRFAKPRLAYRLSGDYESAADEIASESISHYVFDGSVLFHLGSFGGGRGEPFVSGGAGYVRELHEGNELVETGNEIHATAGLKYWFGARKLGLRVEAGLSSREKGFDRREGRRTLPLVLAGVTMLF